MVYEPLVYSSGQESILLNGDFSVQNPSYVLMQFTGLMDKNGKEIYEGDVGRINIPDIGYVNCICDWNIGGFRWKKINELQAISANPSTSWSLVVPFEVIGNIYENLELLQ